jgi:molybdopterin converting factor subunit 1
VNDRAVRTDNQRFAAVGGGRLKVARLLFFGRLRDSVGTGDRTAALPDDVRDTDAVRAWLGTEHPALLDSSVRIAVNAEIRAGSAPVADGDEIAFLPPMSGG